MDIQEELFVEQLRLGNEYAYKCLFDKHYQVLCHYASRIICDDYQAEALVSDVIFHIWEKRRSLVIDRSVRAFLMTCVRNRCIDYLRSSARKDSTDFESLSKELHDNESPLGILLEKELEQDISRSISELPVKTKEVFEMNRFSGKSYDEIADFLGISVNTVKYHMKQALSILREKITEYGALIASLFFLSF